MVVACPVAAKYAIPFAELCMLINIIPTFFANVVGCPAAVSFCHSHDIPVMSPLPHV